MVSFTVIGTAPLLYVSSTQINFAVPLLENGLSSGVMQVTVNGVSSVAREIPLTYANPSVFVTTPPSGSSFGFVALAVNADGSVNSATNPAPLEAAVSIFVNGLTPNPEVTTAPLVLYGSYGWSVTNVVQASPFVLQANMMVPSPLMNDFSCAPSGVCAAEFILNLPTGGGGSVGQVTGFGGESFGGVVYVNRNQ